MKHFFPRLLNKFGLLKILNLSFKITVNNNSFKIPVIAGIGFNNLFMSEVWMVQVLEKITKLKHGTFIDVGVNIGQTLIKLRSVDKEREYLGFEPNPLCVFYTEELIKKNNIQKSTVISAGIYNQSKVLTLNLYYEKDSSDSSASIIENFRTQEVKKKFFVPVFSAGTLKHLFNNISIIKIDVEGAELEVIESFKKQILQFRPFILTEILPVYEKSNTFRRERTEKIVSFISKMDYIIFRIIKNQNDTFNKFEKITHISVHADLSLCEYIFVPKELSVKFEISE